MKKLVSIVLALVMILMVAVASAATITINRHSSWNDENADPDALQATYTWHRIFDVDLTDADHPVYTISGTGAADKVAALDDTIFEANLAADGKYYIMLKSGVADNDVFEALATMVANNSTLFPGTDVTSDEDPVVLNVGDPGYFFIEASNGKNVAVQTAGTATVEEKNDYPTIDKKQKKANGSWTDDPIPEEVGSVIYYEITVHIPTDATKAIKVFDTMTAGLTYNADLAETNSIPFTALPDSDSDYDSNATFQIIFSDATVIAHRGEDIVLTYSATVNTAAITDTGKENEVTLIYDNGNYVLRDSTDYEIYFGGIYKVDPDDTSADMSGVKFDLKDGTGAAVNVTYDSTNGYYKVDLDSTSNEVVTRAETVGEDDAAVTYYTIKIRGLDNEKTYTLTETETKNGYNLLNGTVTLTKTKDEGQAFADKDLDTFDRVENKKGTTLPSTGGIGTTIFYVLGGILVIGAAVILVARRKAHD